MNDVTESKLTEIAARWEAMVAILKGKGKEVSDFLLSFPEVRQLADIMASQPGVEADAQKECQFCQSWVDYGGGNFCLHCGRRLRTA